MRCNLLILGLSLLVVCQPLKPRRGKKAEHCRIPQLPCASLDPRTVFPRNIAAIERLGRDADQLARKGVMQIIEERAAPTFANLIMPINRLGARLTAASNVLRVLRYAHPDRAIKKAAKRASRTVSNALLTHLLTNRALYLRVKSYATTGMGAREQLDAHEQRYVQELLRTLESRGLALPADRLERIRYTARQISDIRMACAANLIAWTGDMSIDKHALGDIRDSLLNGLSTTSSGSLQVPITPHWYRLVLRYANSPAVREQMWVNFSSRACDRNAPLVPRFLSLCDEYAQLLGFPSYAHLLLGKTMAANPERVESFLEQITARSRAGYGQALAQLKKELHTSVVEPWDFEYSLQSGGHGNKIGQQEITRYLPASKTIARTLRFYEKFLGICFKPASGRGFWHKQVEHLLVHDRMGVCCGHLLLDLYARPGKYGNAIKITVLPPLHTGNQPPSPAIVVILANFPQPEGSRQSLLSVRNVATLFHELGHAVHTLLTQSARSSFGIAAKPDFTEAISQLFEEFLCEPSVWKQLSGHYKTGKPLDDATIAGICARRTEPSMLRLRRRIGRAWSLLNCFLPGQAKGIEPLMRQMYRQFLPGIRYDSRAQPLCSSTHFTSAAYGPRYYAYLWSEVIACDLYNTIQAYGGWKSSTMGRLLSEKILRYGRHKDPMALLTDFLGRKPNMNAFFGRRGL